MTGYFSLSFKHRPPNPTARPFLPLRITSMLFSRARGSLNPRWLPLFMLLLGLVEPCVAIHHMKQPPLVFVNKRDDERALRVTNQCAETIWPGIATQAGTEPEIQGFELSSGSTRNLLVSGDWQGRVWGRTNCTFGAGADGRGQACDTGDCGGSMNCKGTGALPVSLAEFTLASSSGQAFYDISLVDGYNLPLAIISLAPESGNSSLAEIPPNLTNPICIATASLLSDPNADTDLLLGTNGSFPLPLERSTSSQEVERWCPWDLQLNPPSKPGDGVYPYPDDDIVRPDFQPCFSACAKWNRAEDCCTGKHSEPSTCSPSLYSKNVKKVCPDAYSYAYDDQTSTFIIPSGGGFEVVFCPQGRSTTILTTMSKQLHELAQTGHVTEGLMADVMNITLIQNGLGKRLSIKTWSVTATFLAGLWLAV